MQGLKNIIVTGCNKGIGYGIVKNLAAKEGWNIIMACRNLQLAEKSRNQIKEKFPNSSIQIEQLDVANNQSIEQFAKVIEEKYKTIDILLNNAGCAAKGDAFDSDVANFTFGLNFYGTMNLTQRILKNISTKGKVIFVGSMAGKLTRIPSEQIKNKLRNPNITKKELLQIIQDFLQGVKEGNFAQRGWHKWIYGISKIGINIYARVLSQYEDVAARNIQVYTCCPGYVDTDMTSHKGHLTIDEGALTPVFLAQLPFEVNPDYQGKFFEKSVLSSLE